MFDPERIQRLAKKLGDRNDALEFVRQMRCGGKKYDGETEETSFLRRYMSLPTRIPNMTGTATAAATGLRDIPLTDSTVGTELGVGLASLWPMFGAVGSNVVQDINWLRNPANQMLAKKMAATLSVPLLGGSAVEEGVKRYTPYSSVGDFMYNAPVVPGTNWSPAEYDRRHGAPRWQQALTQEALGFVANPGYYTPTGLLAQGIDRYGIPAVQKIAREYGKDFTTHVADPVKKNYQWMKDWYDFVGRKNTQPYLDALEGANSLRQQEEVLAQAMRSAEQHASSFPRFNLSVYPAEQATSATSGFSNVYPTFVEYGGERLPVTVEDIGQGGSSKVHYLSGTGTGTPDTYSFFPRQSKIYEDSMIGKPGTFESTVTGTRYRHPDSVLEEPNAVSSTFARSGHSKSPIDEFYIESQGGKHLPIQREGTADAATHVRNIMKDVEQKYFGEYATTSGSGRLYSEGILSGAPNDFEIIVAEDDFDALKSALQFKESTSNSFAIEGDSPFLPNYGKKGHNVDFQVVKKDSNGNANGNMAWSLFKTMHPAEYESQATALFDTNKDFRTFSPINPNTGKPYTARELVKEFKDGNYQVQHVVNEALGLQKRYYQGTGVPSDARAASELLKQDRPLAILTNKDEGVKQMVRKALDTNAYASVGPNYMHGHEYFPDIDFTNVANNKKFLKHLGIKSDGIAEDPEMMRNMFDAWFLPRTTRYREVGGLRGKAAANRAITMGNHPLNGGSVAGSGSNTTLGSYHGSTVWEPQRGMFQLMPSYNESGAGITDMDDVLKMFSRTESGYTFTPEERALVNDAMKSRFLDMSQDMSLREGGVGRSAAKKLAERLDTTPIDNIDDLDRWFNKNNGPIGTSGLSDITLSDIIQDISERLDIPDFVARYNPNYQNAYSGIWNRKPKRASSVRYIDQNDDWKPYEVGRLLDSYGIKRGSNNPRAYIYDKSILPDDQARAINKVFEDSDFFYSGVTQEALENAGAVKATEEARAAADDLRQKLRMIQSLSDQVVQYHTLLQRYKDMPFTTDLIKAVEKESGLHYGRISGGKRVGQTAPRINGRSVYAIEDEILKSAPEGISHMNIAEVRPVGDGFAVKTNLLGEPDWLITKKNGRWVWEPDDLPFALGGQMYPDGGKFFRTNLQDESPLMYQPILPSVPQVPVPIKYEPEPNYGDYVYPTSTGMIQKYPIQTTFAPVVQDWSETIPDEVVDNAVDLFSDEAIARRALKQRYAESAFNDKAKSHAGAQGAWQIMPITLKDYIGRGKGKAGDLNDPEYNRKVRDWVMGIIPRDLQDLYSDSDSDLVKLAKIYGAYNWGAGNMRKYLRKQREAGKDISNSVDWVEGLNPETKRYIKYLAFDEDIPDTTYTNKAFEEAAARRGYLANGGKIHIKPENRGKFTALKKRTGHSASWFKAHGTPAQKKMAVFALNARKWKHGDGGLLDRIDKVYGNDTEKILQAIQNARAKQK